jgi:hypothetical protein
LNGEKKGKSHSGRCPFKLLPASGRIRNSLLAIAPWGTISISAFILRQLLEKSTVIFHNPSTCFSQYFIVFHIPLVQIAGFPPSAGKPGRSSS